MSGDDVYVLFKGTGSGEWPDNTQGIWATDTAAQLDAANYVRYVHERFGGNITVSGHSKGANKAMCATITTGLAKRCVAFDGQGFGKEFLARYQDEIGRYRDRITAINLDNDFVSALMASVAGTVKWARGNRVWGDADVLKNHSMGSLLTDEMAIDYVDGPGPVHRLVASLTEHILSTVSDEHAHTLAGFLGIFLQEMLVKGKGLPDAWAEAERLWPGGGNLLLAGLASWEELEQFASLFAKDPRIKILLKMVQLYATSVLASGEDDVQLSQRASSGIVRGFFREARAGAARHRARHRQREVVGRRPLGGVVPHRGARGRPGRGPVPGRHQGLLAQEHGRERHEGAGDSRDLLQGARGGLVVRRQARRCGKRTGRSPNGDGSRAGLAARAGRELRRGPGGSRGAGWAGAAARSGRELRRGPVLRTRAGMSFAHCHAERLRAGTLMRAGAVLGHRPVVRTRDFDSRYLGSNPSAPAPRRCCVWAGRWC